MYLFMYLCTYLLFMYLCTYVLIYVLIYVIIMYLYPRDFELLGWCPAGPVLPPGGKVPL